MYVKHDLDTFIDYIRYFRIDAFVCKSQKHFIINVSNKNNVREKEVIEVVVTNAWEYKLLNRELRALYNKKD